MIDPTNSDHERRAEPPLKRMFDAVPKRYDLLNRLLTLRFDERWRRRAARRCLQGSPRRVLDLCCGTGDLTLQIARLGQGAIQVVGLDFSAAMLDAARMKADRAGVGQAVGFVEGDAAAMDFPDGHFDAVAAAFAFRNLTWRNPLRDRALAEVRRVLRPGGTFIIVETSQPANGLLRAAFHAYMRFAVPVAGGWFSGHKAAYRYLGESARNFFGPEEVSSMLAAAGFENVRAEALLGGIAAIHVASKA